MNIQVKEEEKYENTCIRFHLQSNVPSVSKNVPKKEEKDEC